MKKREPCPASSPAGRACQGTQGHDGKHWCCYPGGTDRWSYEPAADAREAMSTATQLATLAAAVKAWEETPSAYNLLEMIRLADEAAKGTQ